MHDGHDVRAAPQLAAPLDPFGVDGPQLQLTTPLAGADTTLTVLRRAAGVLHVHDVSEDGVHVVSLLPVEDAPQRLRSVLDPLGRAVGDAPSGHGAAAALERPQAAVALLPVGRPGSTAVTVVTADDRCWAVRDAGPAGAVRPLGSREMDALVEQVLAELEQPQPAAQVGRSPTL